MGTAILNSGSTLAKVVFGTKVSKNGKSFTLHSVSNSTKEAIKEVAIQKLRNKQTVTKTFLVHVTYVRDTGKSPTVVRKKRKASPKKNNAPKKRKSTTKGRKRK